MKLKKRVLLCGIPAILAVVFLLFINKNSSNEISHSQLKQTPPVSVRSPSSITSNVKPIVKPKTNSPLPPLPPSSRSREAQQKPDQNDVRQGDAVLQVVFAHLKMLERKRATYRSLIEYAEGTKVIAEIRPPSLEEVRNTQDYLSDQLGKLPTSAKAYIEKDVDLIATHFQQSNKYKVVILGVPNDLSESGGTIEYIVDDPSEIQIEADGTMKSKLMRTFSIGAMKDGMEDKQSRYSHLFQTVIE